MLSDDFSTAVLIGGPAASGKTTIARLLARKHGLRWYSTDAHEWSHRARAVAQGLHDEADPAPGDFDRGPLIRSDLDHLATELPTAGTIVEGALVNPGFAPLERSVWLMPSVVEQRRRLIDRSGTTSIDDGLLYGHELITRQLNGTAATIIKVDRQTVRQTLAAVEAAFASPLGDLASAHRRSDRQQVIRYGNRSLVDQLRVSIEHGRMSAERRTAERTFDCECGWTDCTATVDLRPDAAFVLTERASGSIRSATHGSH